MLTLNITPRCVTHDLVDAGGQHEILNIDYDIMTPTLTFLTAGTKYKPCAEFSSPFFHPISTKSTRDDQRWTYHAAAAITLSWFHWSVRRRMRKRVFRCKFWSRYLFKTRNMLCIHLWRESFASLPSLWSKEWRLCEHDSERLTLYYFIIQAPLQLCWSYMEVEYIYFSRWFCKRYCQIVCWKCPRLNWMQKSHRYSLNPLQADLHQWSVQLN